MSSQFTPLTAKRHPSRTLWKCFFANLSWSVRFSSHIFGPVFALALLVQILDICHVLKFYFFFALLKKGCSVRACLRCTLPSWQLRGKAWLSSIRIDPLPSISPLQPTICLGKRKKALSREWGTYPKIIATWHQIYQLRPQPKRAWLESEWRQSNYEWHKLFSFLWVAVPISELQCSGGVK